MRRPLLGAILLLGAIAAGVRAQDGPTADELELVTNALADGNPLAEGSTSALLTPDAATDVAISKIAGNESTPEIVRDRALRLGLALNRVNRVRDGAAVEEHGVVWWLALDELDRELPSGPRETLLERALPDQAKRNAALKELLAGREVAERFCREWNELERNEAETKKYAALRDELERAGNAAIPYLATLLAVPPQAVFAVIDADRGITARQQVRALFAIGYLEARSCIPYVVFHVRGPSFTQCTTARSVLRELGGIEFPAGSDEAAQIAVIDAWYSKGWAGSWERDHLARHTLRWARDALASGDPTLEYAAGAGPRQLETIVGDLDFDADAPLETRAAQLLDIERYAILRCPACIR